MSPEPISVDKLKAMLGGAKAIMDKVETKDYTTGHVDSRALTENGVSEMLAEGVKKPMQAVAPNTDGQYKNIKTSKMPNAIKDVMLKNPIPQLSGPNHTFNLEDVSELAERPLPYPKRPITQPKQQYQQPIVENYGGRNDTVTVSETVLRGIVKDVLLEFLTNSYNKTITENVIKQTLQTLVKEGKISVKKKV